MKVLSLFDGLAGCRIALDRVGITQTKYYSSEIDKYAMQVASHNYPDIIHVGSVTDWQSWDVDWSSINLVTGGFPCQAWSVAGKQGGDKDERGMLFWTMLDVMKMVLRHNPKAKFMMENVKMKKEFEEYITFHTQEALGHVNKILINSTLVSAQNRNRWYWTNIEGVEQPEDLGLVLADVIESGVGCSVSKQGKKIENIGRKKSHCLMARDYKGFGNQEMTGVFCGSIIGRKINPETGKRDDYNPDIKTVQRLEVRGDEKTGTLTTVQKDNVAVNPDLTYRKLTPLECERLQTLPENYTLVLDENGKQLVSNSQRYKMIGNGWTIDVIAHIFRGLKNG